jgi:putative membrane protein
MINRLILQIIAGTLGLWLATQFVPGVGLEIIPGQSQFLGIEFTEKWQILFLVGAVLGFINFFIKPILKAITFPLRILTFGLFGLIINMVMVWIVEIIFLEFTIEGISSLFWTTLIIWGVSFILGIHRFKESF